MTSQTKFPEHIIEALKSKNKGIYDWIALLNYFEDNHRHLDASMKLTIYRKCEYLRSYFNLSTRTMKTYRKDKIKGEIEVVKTIKSPLDIEQEDIVPSTMYQDPDIMEEISKLRERKE